MQKTRLGLAVGFAGAIMYLLGLYGGYLICLLYAGYILLFEENEWLKKCAVKTVVIMLACSVLNTLICFIPSVVEFLFSIINLFGANLYAAFLSRLTNVLSSAVGLVEMVLFIGLAFKALNQGDIPIPAVDCFIEKHM